MLAIGSRTPGGGEGGFTLLEMLVVMAIIGLVMGLGFPVLTRALDHLRFARAATDTLASLRAARAMAIRQGAPARLALGTDRRWWANGQPQGAALPAEVQVALAGQEVLYYPDGTARPTGLCLATGREQRCLQITAGGLVA